MSYKEDEQSKDGLMGLSLPVYFRRLPAMAVCAKDIMVSNLCLKISANKKTINEGDLLCRKVVHIVVQSFAELDRVI